MAVALTRRLRLVASGALVVHRAGDRCGASGSRASTCARTGGPTWPAAGVSGPGYSRLLAAIALVVEYIRHNGGEQRGRIPDPRPPTGRDEQPGPLQHRDRHRRWRAPWCSSVTSCSSSLPGGALLRPRLGEARAPGVAHAVRARRRCWHRCGDRLRDRLDLRHLRRGRLMPAQTRSFLEALDEVSDAVESGAGLPAVARAAGRALEASVIVLDAGEQRARRGVRVAGGRARGDGRRGRDRDRGAAGGGGRGGQPALPAARRAAAGRAAAAGGEPDRARSSSAHGRPSERARRRSATSSRTCSPGA